MSDNPANEGIRPAPIPPITTNGEAVRGLPPVTPPSSRHIVQMFVVPGVIVGGVVMLALVCSGVFNYFFGFGLSQNPKDFVELLENPNPDVRWRAANDLAQVLKRNDELASDAKLGLKLADLLSRELALTNQEEKNLLFQAKDLTDKEQQAEREKLKSRREYIRFLSACLGNMTVPVGAPVLIDMAKNAGGGDPKNKSVASLRRHAVWVLANLGENLKRYPKLPQTRRDQVLANFKVEAADGPEQRRHLAELTVAYLEGKKDLGVIAALAELADPTKTEDIDLREMVAYAFTFWDGTLAENAVAEKALVRLAGDRGNGSRILLGKND